MGGGGKGGKAQQEVAEYRMSIHVGWCHAVDKVIGMWVKEKPIPMPASISNTTVAVNQEYLFGGVKEEGGLQGVMHILHGRDDQVLSSFLKSKVSPTDTARVPGYRGILSTFFTEASGASYPGFYWSANTPYLHPVWLKVARKPGSWYAAKAMIGDDANPVHIIRDCLTNTDWGLGLPESSIDSTSFTSVADTLYSEGFGLSMVWSGQTKIEDFINEVLDHVDCTYGIDPATGKIYLKLIRGDYTLGSLPVLTMDNCTITSFSRKGVSETTNEVVVTWKNPQTENDETVVVHDLANYAAQGQIVSTSFNYYGIRKSSLALRAATRELNKASQPVAMFEASVDRTAWNFKSGDVVLIDYDEYGMNGVPCRITRVDYGKPGAMAIRLTLIEDVFDMPNDAYVSSDPSEWLPSDTNSGLTSFKVITAPYFFVARALGEAAAEALTYPAVYNAALVTGYGAFAQLQSQTTNTVGETVFGNPVSIPMCSSAKLGTALTKQVRSEITLTELIGDDLAVGALMMIGNEIAIVESLDPISIRRGMLDTVPATAAIGDDVIIINPNDLISDGIQNVVGTTLDYRAFANGGDPADYIEVSNIYTDRAFRPYRPANVRINGELWPVNTPQGPLVVTWSHRNRLLENGTPITWDAGSVTVEAGVTYNVRFLGGSTVVHTNTGITGDTYTYTPYVLDGPVITVEVWAVRDGYSSEKVIHTVNLL